MKNFLEKYNFNVWLKPSFYLFLLIYGEISATEIVILYAIETIVVGLFHLIKLLIISVFRADFPKEKWVGLFYSGFFIIHYGIFVFVQTTFFFQFLSMEDQRISDSIGFQNFSTVLGFPGIQVGLALMLISYAMRFWIIFYQSGYYKTVRVESYIFQPYLRIFIQQFVAIIPGIFIIFGNAGFIAAVLLIIIRGVVDFFIEKMRADPIYFTKAFNFLFKEKIKEGLESSDRVEAEKFLKMIVNE